MGWRKKAASLFLAGTLTAAVLAPAAFAGDGYGGYWVCYDNILPDTAADGYVATDKTTYTVNEDDSRSIESRRVYQTDSSGKLLQYTENNEKTVYQYDGYGQLASIDWYSSDLGNIYADGHYGHTDLTYNSANNISHEECKWFGTNVRYDYFYDAQNRMIKSEGKYDNTDGTMDEHTEIWQYDSNNHLLTHSDLWDGQGEVMHYEYDAAGHLVRNYYQYTTSNEIFGEKTYTYDEQGRMLTETQIGSVTTYSYDGQNRLISEIQNYQALMYEYDAAGNLVRENNYINGNLSSYTVYSYKKISGSSSVPQPSGQFTDVPDDIYYAGAVKWAVGKGITSGTSATTFSPDNSCTRGQIVTMLWRAMGSPAPAGASNPFTDVNSNNYYYQAALWAVQNGITSGTSPTTFSPEDTCTRAQAMTFIWSAQGKRAGSIKLPFTDVPVNTWYYSPVRWAVQNGITSGTSATTFSPTQTCTRAQIVTFIYKAMT